MSVDEVALQRLIDKLESKIDSKDKDLADLRKVLLSKKSKSKKTSKISSSKPKGRHTFTSDTSFSESLNVADLLATKTSFYTNYLLAYVRLMAFKTKNSSRKSLPSFIVIAAVDTLGKLHIYDMNGQPIVKGYDLGHGKANIVKIDHDGAEANLPIIISAGSDSSIHFHSSPTW